MEYWGMKNPTFQHSITPVLQRVYPLIFIPATMIFIIRIALPDNVFCQAVDFSERIKRHH